MNDNRRTEAWNKRQAANQLAHDRPHPKHYSNGDEQKFVNPSNNEQTHLMSYTKGLPHNYDNGLISNPSHFADFVKAIDSGNPRDFRDVPLGVTGNRLNRKCENKEFEWRSLKAIVPDDVNNLIPIFEDPDNPVPNEQIGVEGNHVNVRAWESQSAGLAFELEGPDAQAVTMPPAPKLGSAELTAEIAEVYVQALLRDTPFSAMTPGVMGLKGNNDNLEQISIISVLNGFETDQGNVEKIKELVDKLKELDWFNGADLQLNINEVNRRNGRQNPNVHTAFRGITKGDDIGPYLSQFLLIGNTGINGNDPERKVSEGKISYGAISADQKVRVASPGIDYMTNWHEWMDVQRGADLRGKESYIDPNSGDPTRRFIHTPRDLATYVHYDALYEAYLNACLILLGQGAPLDPGIPFQEPDNIDHQQGFAHFGGPHILSLVTEVATRALKAVRFQKYNVHRRCRPEVLAARIHKADALSQIAPELAKIKNTLYDGDESILKMISAHNQNFTSAPLWIHPDDGPAEAETFLLPMAFCEGSPMHPAYGAGHATVAGACVTILKAFFDHSKFLTVVPEDNIQQEVKDIFLRINPNIDVNNIPSSNLAYVSASGGSRLDMVPVLNSRNEIAHLTVEGELNKLASNISIGRNWAGVHYFTDYYESLLMGEKIAIGILEEQKLMFGENFSMTVPLFNGDSIRI